MSHRIGTATCTLSAHLAPIPSKCTHPISFCQSRTFTSTRNNQADLIRRPRRPYQFTQLLTLSDGSTVLHRTTSPAPVYRSSKDVRNTPLWNPANARLANVEEDEAGRLSSFRRRFGRGFDTGNEPATAGSARIDPVIKPGSMEDVSRQDAEAGQIEAGKANVPKSAALRQEGETTGVWDATKEKGRKDMPKAPQDAAGTPPSTPHGVAPAAQADTDDDNLMDLISSFSAEEPDEKEQAKAMPAAKKPAGKGGKKK